MKHKSIPKISELIKKKSDKLKDLLDNRNFIIFFKKGNDVFGAPEESRIIFSKLKMNDPDLPFNDNNLIFTATNLLHALNGNEQEDAFTPEDMPLLKVIDRDQVERLLPNC